MSDFKVGDLVVLSAGSMRMSIESINSDKISTVWCNEGVIGRDTFASVLLKKWEHREEDKQKSGRNNFRSTDRSENRKDERPRGKTGWDGKPREKKYFRKD